MSWEWKLEEIQTGLVVASGYVPTQYDAIVEGSRYQMQYEEDGPTKLTIQQESTP